MSPFISTTTVLLLPLLLLLAAIAASSACPDGCSCMDRDDVGTTFCMNKELRAVPDLPKNTQHLYLQGHVLGTLPKASFVNWPALRTLVLEDCGIHTIEAGAFDGLSNVTLLNLKGNQLRELRAGTLAGLSDVMEITLDSNDLRVIHDFAFDGLENHVTLKLENNPQLSELSVKAFKGSVIQEVYFYNCSLTAESLRALTPLQGVLSVFFLTHNRRPLELPHDLFRGFKLLSLNLARNGLRDAAFLRHVTADDISLEYNDLGTLSLSRFPALQQTRVLRLSHTGFSRLDGASLASMGNLRQLYLAHNQISTLSETLRAPFNRLERLSLEGNPLHCNCELRWFRTWLSLGTVSVGSPTCTTPTHTALQDLPGDDLESMQCEPPSDLNIEEQDPSSPEGQGHVDGIRSLRCSARGDPAPVISWTLPDGRTSHAAPATTDRRVQEAEGSVDVAVDGGKYVCTASNLAGNVSRIVIITPLKEHYGERVRTGSAVVTTSGYMPLLLVATVIGWLSTTSGATRSRRR